MYPNVYSGFKLIRVKAYLDVTKETANHTFFEKDLEHTEAKNPQKKPLNLQCAQKLTKIIFEIQSASSQFGWPLQILVKIRSIVRLAPANHKILDFYILNKLAA
jgi:hypothetical protein